VVARFDRNVKRHVITAQYAKGGILTHNGSMNRILIIGSGDIALRVAPLLNRRFRLFGLARRKERFAELRAAHITPLPGDLDDPASLARISGLANIVLHFAPPATAKISPPSLVAHNKNRAGKIVDARTCHLLAALSRGTLPKCLVYISTSGVYGDCGGAHVSETHPLHPLSARGQLRVNAECQIRVWAKRNGVQAAILRVPGIYAADRLPLERLRLGSPSIIAEQDSYTNHVHADDLARIVVAALRYAAPNRVYHASDDSHLKMADYFDAVADAYALPRPPRLSRLEVKRMVSPMLWSFMNESRQLSNQRMKQELKVKLLYPTVADALKVMRC
jgi:nucleoside-diphosphate-sugar epimerase